MWHRENLFSFFCSIIIHVLLFSLLFLECLSIPTFKIPGTKKIIQAQLVTITPQKLISPLPVKKKSPIHIKAKKTPHHSTQKKHPRQSNHHALSGNQLNKLVIILFGAIQSHQHYPAIAKSLGMQGQALISFMLYPNGTIHNIRLAHSSGYSSLDKAALNAVKQSSPIAHIKKYLSHQTPFTIPINFTQQQ